ncbi:hypothetical protein KFK09_001440 [Dendrobium nobile]|uniref:Uncharacterized protein n=1 Tax=Dendrobium nobile TaxID=94219 RepID=A0A8T3C4V7_DENNO|nr:hypothetical protein KFK09_001440 [Dendrobium nobile]
MEIEAKNPIHQLDHDIVDSGIAFRGDLEEETGFKFWVSVIVFYYSYLHSYVSETTKQYSFLSMAQHHILAGLASAVGGFKASKQVEQQNLEGCGNGRGRNLWRRI